MAMQAKIFPVETRFQQMATRPGGVSRDAALDMADRAVEDMKPGFNLWLEEELRALICAVDAIHSTSSPTLDPLAKAATHSRAIHDVGATMGLQLVTFVAEGLTGLFEAATNGGGYEPNRTTCFVEALLLARQAPYRTLGPDDVPELARGLRMITQLGASEPNAVDRSKTA